MAMTVGKGQPITNDGIGNLARELGLDKTVILGLEDLTVGIDAGCHQRFRASNAEESYEWAVGVLRGPVAVEMGDPRST